MLRTNTVHVNGDTANTANALSAANQHSVAGAEENWGHHGNVDNYLWDRPSQQYNYIKQNVCCAYCAA